MKAIDLQKDSGLRYLFVTASPVLTNEVKRFYSNIKEQLINYLRAKEIEQKDSDDEDFVINDSGEDKIPLSAEDIERKELLEFIEL